MTLVPAIASSVDVDVAAMAVTHSAALYKVAYSVLRDPDAAKDVVQDVLLRVMKNRARLSEISDIRIWLVRIAWNLALDRKKQKKGDQMDAHFAVQLVAAQPSAQHMVEQTQRFHAVLRAIDRLPKPEKQALLLTTVNEIGTPEIARVMKRTEAAVRGLVHRARMRLQKDLEGRL